MCMWMEIRVLVIVTFLNIKLYSFYDWISNPTDLHWNQPGTITTDRQVRSQNTHQTALVLTSSVTDFPRTSIQPAQDISHTVRRSSHRQNVTATNPVWDHLRWLFVDKRQRYRWGWRLKHFLRGTAVLCTAWEGDGGERRRIVRLGSIVAVKRIVE